jgi:hypothetical protein
MVDLSKLFSDADLNGRPVAEISAKIADHTAELLTKLPNGEVTDVIMALICAASYVYVKQTTSRSPAVREVLKSLFDIACAEFEQLPTGEKDSEDSEDSD